MATGAKIQLIGRLQARVRDKDLPSGYVKIAFENGHLWLDPLKTEIFQSYVSLLEGNSFLLENGQKKSRGISVKFGDLNVI